MISEKDKYATNEVRIGLPSMDIFFLFTIEYWIAIILYFLIRILNFIKSLLPKPPRDLTGDVVVITGATSTLGTFLAEEFAKKGCSIICIDKDNNLVQQLALDLQSRYTGLKDNFKGKERTEGESLKNPRIIAYQCDTSNPKEMKDITNNFKNEFGGIDILVTCIDSPCVDIFDTAMTIWMNHYSTIIAFLSLMLRRERVYIIGVTPVSDKDASISSGIALNNLMEYLCEKLCDFLINCTFLAISPITKKGSIKQSEQQVAKDIVEAVRRNQSSLIYGWNSRFLYRASCVISVIITKLTKWYRD
ncbi:PREDICTED: short-chain dehydrogenase/reductase family 16C member 6-like [Polistes canadensis]|uniref:short-chain dehydrogenase/reductase family 16C member 6-like n=1 Tax=Polistes canadensis TaxID=91411 RepID=UPI000718D685|nr:PREDICTED: short-chain dehydrogenase/reductase family 16C member 6-like [Polistes canadensis]XP_014601521.1 PREDICTED: short-chain dehydrogenase/reductase family 16C member 6-like [Polistes canadensis]